jgi:hypothetical protein
VLNTLDRLDGRMRRMESGDARLTALDPGKRLILSTVWDGQLKPRLDRLQDDIRDLITPLALGRTLTAEPAPAATNLGKVWDGLAQLERLVADAKARALDDDERERAGAVIEGHLNGHTGDSRPRGGFLRGLMRRHHAPGDAPRATTAADVNAANRSHWADRSAAATRSAATDAGNRNAFGDLGAAAHARDRVRNINQAARSFWRGRAPKV